MDESYLDHAERIMQSQIDAGIAKTRKKEPPPPGFDGTCECEAAIPPQRIAMGYYRCVACQTQLEKSNVRPPKR